MYVWELHLCLSTALATKTVLLRLHQAMFERLEGEVKELANNITALKQNKAALNEMKFVLNGTDECFFEVHQLISDY